MQKRSFFSLRFFLFGLFAAVIPNLAFADSGGFELVSILESLIDLLQSDIARIVFVLSILSIGYGWLYLGRIPKDRAIGAIIGIGIIFSASYIAQQLGVGGY